MIDPKWKITKGQISEWLNAVLVLRAAEPAEVQLQDNSGTIISAIQTILDEFEDESDLESMLTCIRDIDGG